MNAYQVKMAEIVGKKRTPRSRSAGDTESDTNQKEAMIGSPSNQQFSSGLSMLQRELFMQQQHVQQQERRLHELELKVLGMNANTGLSNNAIRVPVPQLEACMGQPEDHDTSSMDTEMMWKAAYPKAAAKEELFADLLQVLREELRRELDSKFTLHMEEEEAKKRDSANKHVDEIDNKCDEVEDYPSSHGHTAVEHEAVNEHGDCHGVREYDTVGGEMEARLSVTVSKLSREHDEYTFLPSCWDAGLLVFSGGYGRGGDVIVLTQLIITIVLVGIFSWTVVENFTVPPFSRDAMDTLGLWRYDIAHRVDEAHAITGVSLVARACHNDYSLTSSGQQIEVINRLKGYLGRDTSLDGEKLCLVALAYWILKVLEELTTIIFWFDGLLNQVVCAGFLKTVLSSNPDGHFEVQGISAGRFVWACVLAAVRFGNLTVLFYGGSLFLCYTITMTDLLLNAACLELVLNVDELIFAAMAPVSSRILIANILPLHLHRKRSIAGADMTAVIKIILFGISLVLCWRWVIDPFHDDLQMLYDSLCGGDVNYVYKTDYRGVPWMVSSPEYEVLWPPKDFAIKSIVDIVQHGGEFQIASCDLSTAELVYSVETKGYDRYGNPWGPETLWGQFPQGFDRICNRSEFETRISQAAHPLNDGLFSQTEFAKFQFSHRQYDFNYKKRPSQVEIQASSVLRAEMNYATNTKFYMDYSSQIFGVGTFIWPLSMAFPLNGWTSGLRATPLRSWIEHITKGAASTCEDLLDICVEQTFELQNCRGPNNFDEETPDMLSGCPEESRRGPVTIQIPACQAHPLDIQGGWIHRWCGHVCGCAKANAGGTTWRCASESPEANLVNRSETMISLQGERSFVQSMAEVPCKDVDKLDPNGLQDWVARFGFGGWRFQTVTNAIMGTDEVLSEPKFTKCNKNYKLNTSANINMPNLFGPPLGMGTNTEKIGLNLKSDLHNYSSYRWGSALTANLTCDYFVQNRPLCWLTDVASLCPESCGCAETSWQFTLEWRKRLACPASCPRQKQCLLCNSEDPTRVRPDVFVNVTLVDGKHHYVSCQKMIDLIDKLPLFDIETDIRKNRLFYGGAEYVCSRLLSQLNHQCCYTTTFTTTTFTYPDGNGTFMTPPPSRPPPPMTTIR